MLQTPLIIGRRVIAADRESKAIPFTYRLPSTAVIRSRTERSVLSGGDDWERCCGYLHRRLSIRFVLDAFQVCEKIVANPRGNNRQARNDFKGSNVRNQ
jgi:hypothetical protein